MNVNVTICIHLYHDDDKKYGKKEKKLAQKKRRRKNVFVIKHEKQNGVQID